MKQRLYVARRLIFGMTSLLALGSCGGCDDTTQDVSIENFTATINSFLAERGHLCLAKYEWPIYVTADDQAAKSPDAIQMPVLEKLGLAVGSNGAAERKDKNGRTITENARKYELTPRGQQYYLHVPVVIATPKQRVTHPADLCVATLTLDKVVGWEPPQRIDGQMATSVVYTYKIDPAPWTQTPEAQHAFPVITRAIEGAGTMQLREGVHLTPNGWVADELSRP